MSCVCNVAPSWKMTRLLAESTNSHNANGSCTSSLKPATIVHENSDDAVDRMIQRPKRAPPEDPSCPVLYADSRYVVVNKVVRARGFADPPEKVRNVHRLDYATSGIVILALTKHGAAIASDQFERRTVEKKYIALLHGHVPCPEDGSPIAWTWNIAPTDGFNMQPGTVEDPGRSARTLVYVLEHGTYFKSPVTKVIFSPASGRRHQLRVHAATAGYPIVGDASYIADENAAYFADRPGFIPPRMMLHAKRLEIELPPAAATVYGRKSGLRIATKHVFEAPDPFEDMAGLKIGHCSAKVDDDVEKSEPNGDAAESKDCGMPSALKSGRAGWCVIQ